MADTLDSRLDTPFEIVEIGVSGNVDLIPTNNKRNPKLFLSTLPFGPPPLLKDVRDELEDYFLPDRLPIHNFERSQRFWPRQPNIRSIISTDLSSPATTLQVERDPSGEILQFCEIELSDAGGTAKTSFSLNRLPGRPEDAVRGSAINYPFWPGGLEEPVKHDLLEELTTISFERDLLTVPPGFDCGMEFEPKAKIEESQKEEDQQLSHTVNLIHILTSDEFIEDVKESKSTSESIKKISFDDTAEKIINDSLIPDKEAFDDVISKAAPVLEISKTETNLEIASRKAWAEKLNTDKPIEDFYKRIPNMAKTFPFELDIFQKQAVLCLENNDSVFVAAHTSAGKTVVAEYAIAITQRNKTRAIYTSPIKALSNQKFYDFKNTFEDVGLLTGDLQINPKASCLIMTTEILRSMLYNGSDTIRDLEWVIFDEVHYINDSERGVVWEEVLIMLPAHVNLVLLSATVPNFMEFADWVGRTKQKKIFVISTSKRPVPLEHYLYTASDSKADGQLHLFINQDGSLLMKGYEAAMAAKKERKSKNQSYGSKLSRQVLNPQQESAIWKGLINFLTKKNQLPVVAFTLSRKRCDENARLMKSLDLTTSSEKSEIHTFFQKCIQRLKPVDRKLPQVISLQEMLKRGIGIHHSGILPILKEVVELLFQKQLVKLLFATETFAMGVNMPTKTVVFDSIRKHDGKNFRNLLPSEYIQMAGRAGRRGFDTTGMVILICKGDIPELSELRQMMLGKPTILESKFRLTYSMILNLLRLEQVRVVDMLKRSFLEVSTQKNLSHWQKELKKLKEYASNQKEVSCPLCEPDLKKYYEASTEILNLQQDILEEALKSQHCGKILHPGRVVVLQHIEKGSVLGVILRISKSNVATMLLLWDEEKLESLEAIHNSSKPVIQPEEFTLKSWQCCVAMVESSLFIPDGTAGHLVMNINVQDIMFISTESLKLDENRIMTDWAKRQQPRFRFDPPGPSCSTATQQLLRLSEENTNGLPYLDIAKELKLNHIDIPDKLLRMKDLRNAVINMECIKCHSFKDHFHQMYENMERRNLQEALSKKTSDESLSLHDDYLGRIEILKELEYIDSSKNVKMKGRVACEISNHELMVTELVMQNVTADLTPPQIAALLSCLVFQQKTEIEPELTGSLKKAKDKIEEIAENIGYLHRQYQLKDKDCEYEEQFKFGLVEVTLKWAQGVPFAEIAKMTDVQEGIIVRCIQRLDEILKDVRKAAKTIGEPTLEKKMEDASISIKRDIVFAASLYTQ